MGFWLYPQLLGNLSWYMHYPWHDFSMINQMKSYHDIYETMLIFVSVLAPRIPQLTQSIMYTAFVFEPFQCIVFNHMERLALKVFLLCRSTSKESFEIIWPKAFIEYQSMILKSNTITKLFYTPNNMHQRGILSWYFDCILNCMAI